MKPILFDTMMVKAILDGRKTMMRRVVTYQPDYHMAECHSNGGSKFIKKWKPGDVLYVREPAQVLSYHPHGGRPVDVKIGYPADGSCVIMLAPERFINREWFRKYRRIPNGCFREAARIFLKVTDVRVERLRDITEADAKAEGVKVELSCLPHGMGTFVGPFEDLWDSTYAKCGCGWDTNPWVYCISFKSINREEAER